MYFNARSIFNKIDELQIVAYEYEPDLILICETWCNTEITNAMLSLQGYNIENELRKDRCDTNNGIGGGLLVYAKEGMIIRPRSVENDFNQCFPTVE